MHSTLLTQTPRVLRSLGRGSGCQIKTEVDIERWYRNHDFPAVSNVLGGDVMLCCWRGRFSSAKEALDLYILHNGT